MAAYGENLMATDSLRNQAEGPAKRGSLIMELGGLEPPTSWVRSRRSPN
jgi:hypothetical protein